MVRGLEQGRRAALVISECQRGVLDPDLAVFAGLAEHAAGRHALARVAELADRCRALGLPVVHAHVAHRPDFAGMATTNPISALAAREGRMVAGTAEVEAMDEVAPEPADHVSLRRSGLGMWYGTDLDATLRHLGVGTVVLTGVSTNVAIVAGCLGAVDRGYHAVVAEDATAGASTETHKWNVEHTLPLLATVSSSAEVVEALA